MNIELSSAFCFHRVVKASGLILGVLLFAVGSFGQGAWIRVGNTPTTLIYTNDCNGTRGLISGSATYRFGLYVAPGLNQPSNSLTLAGLTTNSAVPGRFGSTDPVSLPAGYPAGSPMTFQVRGWSMSATNPLGGAYYGASDIGYVTPSSTPELAPYIFGTDPGQVGGFELRCGECCQLGAFTNVLRLTNREIALRFVAPSGINFRIDTATNLSVTNTLRWNSLLTLRSAGVNQHTDSAAPYASSRFYRAEQLTGSNILTGDNLVTTNGDAVIHPINHASFVMSWNGKMIYNDPVGGATPYAGLARADLILVSHDHSDHYDIGTLNAVRGSNGVIIVPSGIYNSGGFSSLRTNAVSLAYGVSTNVMGINIQAVPAYNGNHPSGANNAYVTTLGGKRIFTSGDCGDGPEIRALTNIDVAFLCMNVPYTTDARGATNIIRAMRPKVVYPYHYRDQSGTVTNAPVFKQWLGTDLGIEVRLRKWY